MRKPLSQLVTAAMAAGLSLATATPAAAADYCFGMPDNPLAYVCVGLGTGEPTLDPVLTWGEPQPVTIRSVCYGVGCTEETTVAYVSLPTGVNEPPAWPIDVRVTWNGYSLPADLEPLLTDVAGIVWRVIERHLDLDDPICTDTMCL